MSRPRLPRTDTVTALIIELRNEGYSFRGKHGKLIVDVNGREEAVIVSLSPSDRRAMVNAVGWLRRRIRKWRAEAVASLATETAPAQFPTLEKETMDHMPVVPALTMSSAEIADLLEARHDSVKRTVERLAKKGTIELPPVVEVRNHLGQMVAEYRIGKRDSYIVVAQLSPEFTAKIVDRWQELEGREAQRLSVGDDAGAILSLLADLQTAVISAQQSGAGTALEHVDGAKAAVLHYLKAYLKEPAQAFYEDVRHRNTAAYQRDVILTKGLAALAGEVRELLNRAKPALLERPFLWSEWYDAARIYSEEFPGQAIPKQQFLSQAVARALDSICKRSRQFHLMEQRIIGGRPKNFWHRDIVQNWLLNGGREVIAAHVARHGKSGNVVSIAGARP